jgi:hypothetical protein
VLLLSEQTGWMPITAVRFFWASLSDHIGRKNAYYTFFLLGIAMYALAPCPAQTGNKALFVAFFCIILSM